MLFKLFPSLRNVAVLLLTVTSTVLTSEIASSADLRLQIRPVVQREAPSDWRARLFEEFRRYLQKQNH
jgi:hypothetical protein